MAYTTTEESQKSGVPVELYEFQLAGTSTYWRYTSAPTDVEYGGNTYPAVAIKRGKIQQTFNAMRSMLEIEAEWSNPFAAQYISGVPDSTVYFTLTRGHDPDYVTYWTGRVSAVRFTGNRKVMITCSPGMTDLERSGLVLRFGRVCLVPQYSTQCGLTEADCTIAGVVEDLDGLEVVSSAFATKGPGWFSGGKFYADGYTRKVMRHTTDTVTLVQLIPGLSVGHAFTVSLGCPHVYTACHTRFDNVDNCKAHPFIPDKNPFLGTGI